MKNTSQISYESFLRNKKINPEETIIIDFLEIYGSQVLPLIKTIGYAGIVCSSSFKKNLGSENTKIGYFFNNGDWQMPITKANSILLFGSIEELGGKRLFSLFSHGINNIIFADTYSSSKINYESLAVVALRYVIRRIFTIIYHLLVSSFPKTTRIFHIKKNYNKLLSDLPFINTDVVEKKVVLINNGLAPGGAERQFINTALELKKAGYNVNIIVLKSGDAYFDFYRERAQLAGPIYNLYELAGNTKAFGKKEDIQLKNAIDWIQVKRRLYSHLNWSEISSLIIALISLKPSIVHAWQDSTNISAGIASLIVGVPKIVLSTRNMAPYRFAYFQTYMFSLYRILLKFNITIMNNSVAGAQDYERWLKLLPGRIPVVLNGIDFCITGRESDAMKFRSMYNLPSSHLIVGGIFRFWPEKDPLLWINTASEIARAVPTAKFLLVGEGPLHDEIVDHATRKGIADRLVLPGYLKDPIPAYLSMDVFLLTSKFEGTPNVLIEAQMAGVPAVTTDAGGCRDIIKNNETGFILENREPKKLAENVIRLLLNKEVRLKMSLKSKKNAAEKFGLQQMINKTLDLYDDK
jgi:glycosyltransferase involved in cell wall biosynthesis